MSYSACPLCFAPLEGYPGSPCTNGHCLNSRAFRSEPRHVDHARAPLSGQVTERDRRTTAEQRERRARRRQTRDSRRRNRRS